MVLIKGSVVGVGNRFGLGDMYGLAGSLLYGIKIVWVELVLLWVLMALVWVLLAVVWVLLGHVSLVVLDQASSNFSETKNIQIIYGSQKMVSDPQF